MAANLWRVHAWNEAGVARVRSGDKNRSEEKRKDERRGIRGVRISIGLLGTGCFIGG